MAPPPAAAAAPPSYRVSVLRPKGKKGAQDDIIARLCRIEKQSFCKEDSMVNTLHQEVAKNFNRVLVAEAVEPGKAVAASAPPKAAGIVGYMIYSNNLKQEGCAKIQKIAVDPQCRRGGVGTQLLNAALDLMKKERSPAVQLHVAYSREPAIALYRSVGFETVGSVDDYYAPGRHAYIMQKPIL